MLNTSSDDITIQNAIREIALDYHDKGWNPLPIPYRKKERPPVGFTGASGRLVVIENIEEWARQGEWGNLAVRVPCDVIGIDVDHYDDHCGGHRIEEAEKRLGGLPSTYASTSRPHTPSGIWFYRVPPLSEGQRWKADPFPHVQTIQFGHRYAIVAPSVHPTTGNQYCWYDPSGEPIETPPSVDDLTELPWAWIDELLEPCASESPTTSNRHPTTEPVAERHSAVERVVDEWHSTKHGGRHDALNHAVLALTRLDSQGYPGAADARHDVETDFFNLVTGDGTRTEHDARAEIRRSVDGAEQVVMTTASTIPAFDPTDSTVIDWMTGEITTRPVYAKTTKIEDTIALPDEFFDARPVHAHIRDAARSRRVSPTAAFVHLLARIAAATPPSYCVPPFVGSTVPLTLFVAQVSMSGQGKSSAVRLVDDLLPDLDRPVPLGSGEGFAECYFGDVKETENGQSVTKKRQVRYGMAFELDEGSALADLAARSGSTILPVLRTAWSGSTLGNSNASADKRRQIPAGNYAAGLTLLFQPTNARQLFDDVGGGLPQRFLFVRAGDPNPPSIDDKPEFPGPIDWKPLPIIAIDRHIRKHPLDYPPLAEAFTDAQARRDLEGTDPGNPLDSHRNLHHLKIAGLLALLDGNRTTVTDDDWNLAEMLLDYSDKVRASVLEFLAEENRRKQAAKDSQHIRRAAAADHDAHRRALESALRTIVNKVKQTTTPVKRSDLTRAMSGRQREFVTIDDVLTEAVKRGLIDVTDAGYVAGKRAA